MISVILPSIRVERIPAWLHSLHNAYDGKIEVIVIGPYAPMFHADIRWIKDFGSVPRCMQLGLIAAQGDYILNSTDDGLFYPDAINRLNLNELIISFKYTEDNRVNPLMQGNDYWNLRFHPDMQLPGVPFGTKVFSMGIIKTEILVEMGGWDAETFEGWAMAANDLSIRLKKEGYAIDVTDDVIMHLDHEPGRSGTHAPVHDAQIDHDTPLFKEMYSVKNNRTVIDVMNHWISPEVWKRRFK